MKRLLPFIPVLLFLLVNSCTPADPPPSSNDIATMIANAIIATMSTATPTPTSNPTAAAMVNWLNMQLVNTNSLGATIDADYHVNDIRFPNISNRSGLIFRVDVGCTCMHRTDCCIPERAFVVILEAMKKNFPLTEVPLEAHQMIVVCSDQKTKSQIGAIYASWQDVQSYIGGNLDGHQLGLRVTLTVAP